MTSVATSKTTIPASVASSILSRLLDEGYGPGAWHGADLRAAVADVSDTTAFWRPGDARHNIAEVALHHAFCAHSVIGQLTGKDAGPFVIDGSDWFELSRRSNSSCHCAIKARTPSRIVTSRHSSSGRNWRTPSASIG